MPRVYLGLGSNVGERDANLDAALAALAELGTLLRTSRRYRSAPVGYLEQPEFLNQAAELDTPLAPHPLLAALREIETGLGRTDSFRNAPRIIDLDILLYDDVVVDDPGLRIPHPRLSERAFVLRPLAELVDRVQGTPIDELLDRVADQDAAPIDG